MANGFITSRPGKRWFLRTEDSDERDLHQLVAFAEIFDAELCVRGTAVVVLYD